jgi:hypothetical protein
MICVSLPLLAACGGGDSSNDAASNAPADSTAAAGAAATKGEAAFLRSLPNACDYLTESLSQELLQATVVQRPPVTDNCAYAGTAGSGKGVGFGMFMWNLEMFNSRTESRAQLQEKASFLADGQTPVTTLNDLGNVAFVFDKGATTSLIILTGLGGTALMSDRIVSELSISYYLSDPNLAYEERLKRLVPTARDHLARLTTLAETTHEGRTGT